jgi:MATE family multidrug resistance protein
MNKRILKLAIPNIISNISIPLLGLVDTSLMGHLSDVAYLGAIALGTMIFNFIYWGLGFLRMGTVGFTAQTYGSKDKTETSFVLYRAILISLILSVIIIILRKPLLEFGLMLTESDDYVKNLAREYFFIRVWAVPASLLILVFTGWFIGMQNSIFPMIVSIAANIFNLGFNFYFVYSLGMKSNGVAYGTLISQYISLLIIFVFFYVYYKKYLIKIKKDLLFNIHKFKAFLNVNSDIFIRTLGIIFVFSFFTIQSANIGDTALATNSVLFQFFILFSYLLDGFANAAEAIIGDAVGKKSRRELILATKKLFLWGLGFSGIFTVGYALIGEFILKMLTDLEPVLKMAKDLMWFVIIMPIISFPAFMLDGIFIGATASKSMRNAMILATLLVFIPLYYFIPLPYSQLNILWISFLSFMFARGLFLALYFNKSVLSLVK